MLFTIKSNFKFPTLATPNEVDRIIKDTGMLTNVVTSGISQSFMFLFCLLDDRIASPTSFYLFFVEENSLPLLKQQLPELEGFCDS